MKKWHVVLFVLVGFLVIFQATGRAEILQDSELHFALAIPEGFVSAPQQTAHNPQLVHAFRKTEADGSGILILIERMHGMIGREKIDLNKAPAGFKGKLLATHWHDFDPDMFEVPEESDGIALLTYNVQVPLKPEAIPLKIAGRREHQTQLLGLANDLLVSLQGESN